MVYQILHPLVFKLYTIQEINRGRPIRDERSYQKMPSFSAVMGIDYKSRKNASQHYKYQ